MPLMSTMVAAHFGRVFNIAFSSLEHKQMSTESKDFDPYAVVLADLRAKRDQLDQAIQAIESVRSGVTGPGPTVVNFAGGEDPPDGGDYLGMSIAEATKKLLQRRRKQMNNTEVLAALKSGGMVLGSADPLNTVGAVLTRRSKDVGDIVKVDRGTWGLKEWYPNRSFNKTPNAKGNNGEAEVKAAPTVSEPPSKPGSSSVLD
jgi:hypothetical protein